MVNRENMEKWIEALENYPGRQARFTFMGLDGGMCALGIGMCVAGFLEGRPYMAAERFYDWLDIEPVAVRIAGAAYDTPLKPDDSGTETVSLANDVAEQSTWTIAQRLRETYLKEES